MHPSRPDSAALPFTSLRHALEGAPALLQSLHYHTAIHCFDTAGTLIHKPTRTGQDDEAMRAFALAAVHHAERIEPRDARFVVAATWQASRAHYLARDAETCHSLAQLCKFHSRELPALYAGYAFEALARAERLKGEPEQADRYARLAEECAESTPDRDAAIALRYELAWSETHP